MPLRDHFRPPLDDLMSWEAVHGGWPMMIATDLNRRLPPRYVAQPQVHLGSAMEIDVATFGADDPNSTAIGRGDEGGGLATAVWAPPRPTLAVTANLPAEYEVRVYDGRRGRRLVAVVELVSPGNKDRPEHRRTFVAKCAALIQNRVCVTIVDLVTTHHFNLYGDLLDLLGLADPSLSEEPPMLYAVTSRLARRGHDWELESWAHPLALGVPLPTLPLWIAEDRAIPLELEGSYEETCRNLRIP